MGRLHSALCPGKDWAGGVADFKGPLHRALCPRKDWAGGEADFMGPLHSTLCPGKRGAGGVARAAVLSRPACMQQYSTWGIERVSEEVACGGEGWGEEVA